MIIKILRFEARGVLRRVTAHQIVAIDEDAAKGETQITTPECSEETGLYYPIAGLHAERIERWLVDPLGPAILDLRVEESAPADADLSCSDLEDLGYGFCRGVDGKRQTILIVVEDRIAAVAETLTQARRTLDDAESDASEPPSLTDEIEIAKARGVVVAFEARLLGLCREYVTAMEVDHV